MVKTIPPLWRDADAYVQLTQDPRIAKFWGHAPVYCYLAKIPLLVGEHWERFRGQPPVPRTIPSQPVLTDSGIAFLIAAQHLGLVFAALLFITTVTRLSWIRLLLSLIWATTALFYTFAHCVGSETLSLILVVWLAARAVRLVQPDAEPLWTDWYYFAALLLISMLTRDLNVFLVALLPLAFLFGRVLPGRAQRPFLQNLVTATAIGLACIAIAPTVPENLARKTKLLPHSRFGYTFLWRLHSITDLPPDKRASLLRKVSKRAPTEQVRRLIELYGQIMSEQSEPLDATGFGNRAIALYGGNAHWLELEAGLKQMAVAFLWPPTPELVNVITADFVAALKLPPTEVSDYLFDTTAFYFSHQDGLPDLAHLSTYQGGATINTIQALRSEHRYFRLWEGLTYRAAIAIWIGALLALAWVARRRRLPIAATAGLAAAFVLVGLAQFAAACVVHDYEPRFCLPMWQLLLLSLFLLLGNLLDCLRPASTRSVPK